MSLQTRIETREATTSAEADRIQVDAFAKGALKVATERDASAHWTIAITWPVLTCREAAARFREWADKAVYESERHRCDARAEVLEAFGDAPVPQALLELFDFSR